MTAQQGNVRGDGPVFVSYRQSDGTEAATRIAWLLRAAGVPVWQDDSDLAPGTTERRLDEALRGGLSGGVLVVTADVGVSAIVRNVEAPALLSLDLDDDFALSIANLVGDDSGGIDYNAPDRLLGKPRGTLSGIKQYPTGDPAGLLRLVREMLTFRAGRLARRWSEDSGRPLHLSIQTRAVPHAFGPNEADLSLRVRPAAFGRLPHPDGLDDLRVTLPLLPQALARTGARSLRITGGAHLSVAFALGSAFPSTLVGPVTVEGAAGDVWSCGTVSRPVSDPPRTRTHQRSRGPVKPTGEARRVLAYVQLVPAPNDAAYTRLLDERHADFDAWETITPVGDGPLDPAASAPLIEEVAGRLRTLVADNDHADLHLLLHCPFPVAVLLGRLCNTLNVTVYEWDNERRADDPDARPRYVPCLAVNPTSASGPIAEVLLTSDPEGADS